MQNNPISSNVFDKAVNAALQKNSKSSIMFLLRERMTREIIETAIPIIIEPLLKRIEELEEEVRTLKGSKQTTQNTSPRLSKLKDAISDVVEIIEASDPLKDQN
jgi:hypothetical protein